MSSTYIIHATSFSHDWSSYNYVFFDSFVCNSPKQARDRFQKKYSCNFVGNFEFKVRKMHSDDADLLVFYHKSYDGFHDSISN